MAVKIISILKYIFVLLIVVILYLFFGLWGAVGYLVFVILWGSYILYSKWESYKAIVVYGSNELHKLRRGK